MEQTEKLIIKPEHFYRSSDDIYYVNVKSTIFKMTGEMFERAEHLPEKAVQVDKKRVDSDDKDWKMVKRLLDSL